ncbi:MAG: ABC transporter ATP-binding protein [Sporolactobacillus sp.]
MGRLEVAGCGKVFQKEGASFCALEPVTFHVDDGRFVSIIGPSGCGKSTLFNMIAGLLQPTSGDILLDGHSIVGRTGRVGYMLQKDLLLPWRTIVDNVILPLEIRGLSKKEAHEKAMPLLRSHGLGGFESAHPAALSGGMRQRAALIRTLLDDKAVMLFDEPFGALDAQTRLHMQNHLLSIWQASGKTVLFVTHDIDEAIYLSDEIVVFSAHPGRMKTSIPVELPRPRGGQTFLDERFAQLKKRLMCLLDEMSIEEAAET